MHISDGVITDGAVLAGTWVLGAGGLAVASRSFARERTEESAALVGVLGAFVFAAQMVNFQIPPMAVSAHVVGTGLLTVLLGPAAAIVIGAAVLLVQALLFQDGGLLAYGANVLNLAVVGALAAAVVVRMVPARLRRHPGIAGAAAAAAILASTVACGIELALGSGISVRVLAVGLGGPQLLAAVAEGVITALAVVGIREILGRTAPAWPGGGAP